MPWYARGPNLLLSCGPQGALRNGGAAESEGRAFPLGAVDETRTRDLNLGKVALYQLSYYRTWCGRRDLNSYALRHQILSLARLPFRHARPNRYQDGDPSEIRTPDTQIKSLVLCQLS